MIEPLLDDEDRRAWAMWMRAAAEHAGTRAFRRHVDSAKRIFEEAAEHAPGGLAWSGGKDSTVMVHLGCVELGMRDGFVVRSEKDDLDFPGEREYVERLGGEWNLRLELFEPQESLATYMDERAGDLSIADDVHSPRSDLSARFFYPLTRAMSEGLELVALGLRAEESPNRRRLRRQRGSLYRLRSGQWRALPLVDWTGLDVFAYAVTRGIEFLPSYRCIGLMHAAEPWRLRKSWWLPGTHARHGQAAWLRRYYPSLFARARTWFHDADLGS